jgi:hypothetical protein
VHAGEAQASPRHLPLAQLFRFPTVHVMARHIEFLVATQRPER